MVIVPPPSGSGGSPPPRVVRAEPFRIPPIFLLFALVPILLVAGVGYWWFIQRIEVPSGHVLVLVNRMGEELRVPGDAPQSPYDAKQGQIVLYPELLAELGEEPDSNKYKGIKFDVLKEGRYFYDPIFWERHIVPAVIIEKDEVGILIRKYGKALPPGKTVATELNERGPIADVLLPNRYNINPYAYDIRRVKQIIIPEGKVGVQTLLHGDPPTNPNSWVVKKGEKGVQPDVLGPGAQYNNPYVRKIDPVDIRRQLLDLKGSDSIRFPSKDSFEITLDVGIEYALQQGKTPEVLVKIGDHDDVKEKIILPFTRSLARIEGSKLYANEFISGTKRNELEERIFEGLKDQCSELGIDISAMVIRHIEPPRAIADPISDRQIAVQQITRYNNEIEVAKSEADLVRETELQQQKRAIGETNREVVTIVKQAEQDKAVALTQANKRLEVAKLKLQAATEQAAAILSIGKADAEIITLNFQAEAEPIASAVSAFGDGETYAQYFFFQKVSPSLKSILASTDGPFAEIFRSLSESKEGK